MSIYLDMCKTLFWDR